MPTGPEPLEQLFETTLPDAAIGGRRLRDWHEAARQAAAPRALQLPDRLFVTEPFVRATLARSAGGTVGVRVRRGRLHEEFGANRFGARCDGEDLLYDLALDPSRAPADERVSVELSPGGAEKPQPGRMRRAMFAPQGDCYIWGIGHWSDLLVANLLALQSVAPGGADTSIAPDARVHRTAVVEQSTVGSGVRIGPYAVVQSSRIGDGCELQEHSSTVGSLLGPDCVVQTGALVHGSMVGDSTVLSFHTATRGSVLLGGSTISAPVVARSVIGRDVFLARGVQITASRLVDQPVVVRVAGRFVSSGLRLLGCAIGNGARVGSGLTLPPGFEIPAGYYLTSLPLKPLGDEFEPHVPVIVADGRYRQFTLQTGGRDEPD